MADNDEERPVDATEPDNPAPDLDGTERGEDDLWAGDDDGE